MTRKEHLAWCKERALVYVNNGDLALAVVSMSSDMNKHPETRTSINSATSMLGMAALMTGERDVRQWIEGFN